MSSGQKKWAEEIEEQVHEIALEKFYKVPRFKVYNNIDRSIWQLNSFLETDPALTKRQFWILEEIQKYLKACLDE